MEPRIVDARGLQCPLPVLKLRKALLAAAPGEQIWLWATDPIARRDVAAFCEATGDELSAVTEDGDVVRFLVARGSR